MGDSSMGAQYDAGYAQQDPAYAAAYGNGAVSVANEKYDPVTYAPVYRRYYESMGYSFPAGFDVVAYLKKQKQQ